FFTQRKSLLKFHSVVLRVEANMKRSLTGLTIAALLAICVTSIAAQKNPQAEAMMAAAEQKATIEGNLDSAIKQYKTIVDKYAKTDRAVAAMALIRMAELYRKIGDAQSRSTYQQVINDYSDHKEAVTLAKAGLGDTAATAGMNLRLVRPLPLMAING